MCCFSSRCDPNIMTLVSRLVVLHRMRTTTRSFDMPTNKRFASTLANHNTPTNKNTVAPAVLERSQRFSSSSSSSWTNEVDATATEAADRPSWSEEWKSLGLGATLRDEPSFPPNLFFVQLGFGVDQHGKNDATKAAIRAVRNAIEFNSIPGVISHIPGGRAKMLIHVKLGIPSLAAKTDQEEDLTETLPVDVLQVAKVFPYGQLLPLEITRGGISFHTGRVVEELGDSNDVGICVAACVTLGYDGEPNDNNDDSGGKTLHKTYNTKDGH